MAHRMAIRQCLPGRRIAGTGYKEDQPGINKGARLIGQCFRLGPAPTKRLTVQSLLNICICIYTHILYQVYKCVFFSPFGIFFSSGRGSFSSCSRLHGTQGARPDPIRKFGPRPRSVARALGVQSGTSARGGIPST